MDDTPIRLPGPAHRLWPWLLALLLVAVGLRAWQYASTEVATRDSIGFIRVAWKLENEPLGQALRSSTQHPLYPAFVLVTSWAVRPFHPGDLPLAMQRSTQIVSCLASLVLALVLFFLGCELFGSAAVGFWAALLYQFLPSPGRLMADGLSEPVFLVLAGTGMLAAVRGLRGGRPGWLALAGLCAGLAYLTRPEGLILAASAVPFLFLRRSSWADASRRAAFLAVPLLAVAVPYVATIGKLTVKASADYFVDPGKWENEGHFKPAGRGAAVAISPLPLAVWWFAADVKPGDRWLWAAYAVGKSASEAFFPGGMLLVLFGTWLYRKQFARDAGFGFVGLLTLIMAALCYRVAQSNGYLSPRHLVMPALAGTCFLIVGMARLAERLWKRRAEVLATSILCVAMAACVPKVLAPLHAGRAAYREAGEWIAAHALAGDPIHDPYAHAYYYAGRVFTEGRKDLPAAGVVYAVLEVSRKPHSHLGYLVKDSVRLAERGKEVCRFPLPRNAGNVIVYRVGG